MRPNLAVKALVFFLTAVSLVIAAMGAVGILTLESNGLYTGDLQTQQKVWFEQAGNQIAWQYTGRYAAQTLGNCPETVLDYLFPESRYPIAPEYWNISLYQNEKLVNRFGPGVPDGIEKDYTITMDYPIALEAEPHVPQRPGTDPDATLPPEATDPTIPIQPLPPVPPMENPISSRHDWIWEQNKATEYYLFYYSGPTYTVRVQFHPNTPLTESQAVLSQAYPYRYGFIAILIFGLILGGAGCITLLYFSGRAKDGTIRLLALNRLPLDLAGAFCGMGCYLLYTLLVLLMQWRGQLSVVTLWLCALGGLGMACLVLAWLYILSTQIKQGQLYWWNHSIVGCCLNRVFRHIRLAAKGLAAVFGMMPLVWQWILTATMMGMALTFTAMGMERRPVFFVLYLIALVICAGIILYVVYCLGALLQGVKKMTAGNLDNKIPTKYLLGAFRDFATELNALSDTAMRSAKESLRSERMKTELVTNVTHDIKTPLTSIISFVDLLQKPHTAEQEKQYLEVLSRQSSRMKKLIEDLIALSKANTGNMVVNLEKMDIAEVIAQALGEFSDKLESAKLTPVFRQPKERYQVLADGRLTWRVIDNLLSNAEKYAMPGTRLYLELSRTDQAIFLTMKNVSREELRFSPEDLLERFVQGDNSRSGGDSGLGLNIAQSLMEVQGGSLQLLLDGDYFKVTLIFPAG